MINANFSNFGILGGFKHSSVLIMITAHKYADPYIRAFTIQQGWDNDYGKIIVSSLAGLLIYLVVSFVTDVLLDNSTSFAEEDESGFAYRLREYMELAPFFAISQILITAVMCFLIYKDNKEPLLISWGMTAALGGSYLLSKWFHSSKKRKPAKRKINKKLAKGAEFVTFKEVNERYHIIPLLVKYNVDRIDREYEDDDTFLVYKEDTTLQEIEWSKNMFADISGIVVDGDLTITTGLKNRGHEDKLLYVTKNLKVSYIQNFDTLIHVDGNIIASEYVYADSFFGYIRCSGEIYAPSIINDGQHVQAQRMLSEKMIDISASTPSVPLYKFGQKDIVKDVLKSNIYENKNEIDDEKLLAYLEAGKPILK